MKMRPLKTSSPTGTNRRRCGAVAVEFAVVAPVLLAIVLGLIELTRVFEAQNLLASAAREGARFAAMDTDGLVPDGQSTNDKLIQDVENFLASNGIPRDDVSVAVKDADNPDADFDLDDPANALKLFQVQVSVDYSAISRTSVSPDQDYTLKASVTFRNGVATISD